jgi:hypothetical protein
MRKAKHEDTTKNIWQVAAGDGERDYQDVLLQFGVMLVGPGTMFGDYRKHKDDYENKCDATTRRTLRQFADEADEKDLVVLKGRKCGRKWETVAVGKISSAYSFEPVFSDVEGFQLQHCRRVEWRLPTRVKYIRLGRVRFSHVNKAPDEVKRLWETGKPIHKFDPIPEDHKNVSEDELVASFVDKGLSKRNAKCIADEIKRLQDLAKWYECDKPDEDYDVSEHETRTFLIVPLIMSLGWDEKKVKIEWEHKDIALFDAPYSKQNEPAVIIESKRLWDGLGDAPEQARRYAGKHKRCGQFLVSDGIRYKLFTKRGGEWHFSAYLNLLNPRRKHPYKPDVGGAVSFFQEMIPKAAI